MHGLLAWHAAGVGNRVRLGGNEGGAGDFSQQGLIAGEGLLHLRQLLLQFRELCVVLRADFDDAVDAQVGNIAGGAAGLGMGLRGGEE